MRDRFAQIILSDKPVLVDFYADWCGPCKMMPPVLKEVKDQFRDQVRILKINVDRNPRIAVKYGIQHIPAVLLFKSGQVKWQAAGVQTVNELSQNIRQYL